MAQFEPYLMFNGTCADAFAFYEKTLGGKIDTMMKFSDAPPQPGQPKMEGDGVMHVSMTVDGCRIMGSDCPPHMPADPMKGFSVSLAYKTADEGKRIFDALSAGGKVTMPYGKTFWAEGFGMFVDRFGTPWMVNAGDQPAG